jgi:hypothetical protein
MLGKLEGSLAVALHRLALNEKLLGRKWWTLTLAVSHITPAIPTAGFRKLSAGASQIAVATRIPRDASSRMHSPFEIPLSVAVSLVLLSCKEVG